MAALVRKPVYKTLGGFEFSGESINESKIVIADEDSAGLSIKGDYPKEDGILASLFTAKAVAARGASLTEQSGALCERIGCAKFSLFLRTVRAS